MAKTVSWPLSLGRGHWVVLTLSLAFILLLSFYGFLHPGYFTFDCEHRYLPSVERRFGFKGGRISLSGRDYKPYALLEVDPGGPLGRAGFRSGDVPVDQHGGLQGFCGALQAAEDGHDPEVWVIDGRAYDSPRRSLRIPPMRHELTPNGR